MRLGAILQPVALRWIPWMMLGAMQPIVRDLAGLRPGIPLVPTLPRGQFFAPGTTAPASCSGANTNGAVVVKVVTSPTTLPNASAPGNPTNSYGFIRFRARVN